MSTRKRYRLTPFRFRLSDGPVILTARLRRERLWLYASAPSRVNAMARARLRVSLSRAHTQAFFRRLADSLGYSLPKSASLNRLPGVLLEESGRRIVIEMEAEVGRTKAWLQGAYAHMAVAVTKKRAQEFCEALAKQLGWELHEWWEYEDGGRG